MNDIEFTYKVIKGKIAETIFEMMFRHSGKYQMLHFGYEYNFPELITREVHTRENKLVLDSISTTPDFIEIDSQEKVTMVEVKFQSGLDGQRGKEVAEKLLEKWPEAWLFVVTPKGFLFDPVKTIVEKNGFIKPLSPELIPPETQVEYLNILHQFNL